MQTLGASRPLPLQESGLFFFLLRGVGRAAALSFELFRDGSRGYVFSNLSEQQKKRVGTVSQNEARER
jgi:hypothetical protein